MAADSHGGVISEVAIPIGRARLNGNLTVPDDAKGLVIFAHGSGSSRFSPRNRFVSGLFNERGLATLLCDLLTPDEHAVDQSTRHLRFDIPLLARRLMQTMDFVESQTLVRSLPIGLFGASTGAAAALIAAAERPDEVSAVVSRGGRPDLAEAVLPRVHCPTLLIVGGYDTAVVEINRQAAGMLLHAHHELFIVPRATHLFEENGKLEEVAAVAADWFEEFLTPMPSGQRPSPHHELGPSA